MASHGARDHHRILDRDTSRVDRPFQDHLHGRDRSITCSARSLGSAADCVPVRRSTEGVERLLDASSITVPSGWREFHRRVLVPPAPCRPWWWPARDSDANRKKPCTEMDSPSAGSGTSAMHRCLQPRLRSHAAVDRFGERCAPCGFHRRFKVVADRDCCSRPAAHPVGVRRGDRRTGHGWLHGGRRVPCQSGLPAVSTLQPPLRSRRPQP